jgi:ABC-type antimicrobial peptide transport system permease subunit
MMRELAALPVALRAAWSVLRQHKFRSVLTLAVCGLGTAGIIVAGMLGRSNVGEMQARLRTLGGNMIAVSPNKLPPFPGRPRQLEHFISLQPEDGIALADVPGVETVVPVVARNTTIRHGASASRVRLIGTAPSYLQVRCFTLARGRFLEPADAGERVIVLGHSVAYELSDARLGAVVYLGGNPYTVVGILDSEGVNFAGEDEDHQAFISVETYQQRIANRPWLSHLYLQIGADADPGQMVQQVTGLLRDRHGRWRDQVDDVIVRDFAELTAQQTGLLTTAIWAVSVTSALLLAMGTIGIATLMMLVVRQRCTEIGLRRALGATPWDIAFQFFVEGILLAIVGVLSGVGIGVAASVILSKSMATPASFDASLALIGVAVSLSAGAAACLIPAISAARLEPAAALRS